MKVKKLKKFWFLIIACNWLYLGFLLDFVIFLKNLFLAPAILIIRLDSIGDYVLFRNFLEEIKKDRQYEKWRLVLAGNQTWKSLAEEFDRPWVAKFIWIDKNKFRTNPFYFLKIALQIKMVGAKVALEPTLARVFKSDLLIGITRAKKRMGSAGYDNNITGEDKKIGNSYYTGLIPLNEKKYFEFEQNKNFCEAFLGRKLETKLAFSAPGKDLNPAKKYEKYIIFFPGAQKRSRCWSPENYGQIAKFIKEKYRYNIIICGSAEDKELADKIIFSSGDKNIVSLAGETNLAELFEIIAGAKFLISNDTCALHMAVAAKIPTICISNGNHFGRFTECPKEIFSNIFYVYPPEIESLIAYPEILKEKFKFESMLDINTITAEKITNLFQETHKIIYE